MAHLVFSNSSSDNPDFSCRYLVFRTKLVFPIAKANSDVPIDETP
jgi:hypothetical protein